MIMKLGLDVSNLCFNARHTVSYLKD